MSCDMYHVPNELPSEHDGEDRARATKCVRAQSRASRCRASDIPVGWILMINASSAAGTTQMGVDR